MLLSTTIKGRRRCAGPACVNGAEKRLIGRTNLGSNLDTGPGKGSITGLDIAAGKDSIRQADTDPGTLYQLHPGTLYQPGRESR